MKVVIVTGVSGGGKSQALKAFEDLGYFCIDNMIPALLPHFIRFCNQMKTNIENVALGIDIRGGEFFENLLEFITSTETENVVYEVLFLECNDEVLIKRFKENRRNHPLAQDSRLINGINKERELLVDIKKRANYTIDTSTLFARQLRERIFNIFNKNKLSDTMIINVLSFGFKYGVPNDADLVFDVRFIPNPYYIDELKLKTGKDKEVIDYVMKWDETNEFIKKVYDLLEFLIPFYIKEGKTQLVIAIGCTGGQHRSVAIAGDLANKLKDDNLKVILEHREQDKK